MTAARINEPLLARLGFDRTTIEALRHVLKQAGERLGEATLPEVAEQVDVSNPILATLQLAVQALNNAVAILEAEQANLPLQDKALIRRVEDLEAQLAEANVTFGALKNRIEDLENRME